VLRFVLLICVVSVLADTSYEGARSITDLILAFLGASAFVTGVVAGVGVFVGYALRIVFGYLSDHTGRYWTIYALKIDKPLYEMGAMNELKNLLR
jgi:hypothetical protein